MTKDQKAAQEEMIARKQDYEAEAENLEEIVRKFPENRRVAESLAEIRMYLCAIAEFEQAPSRRQRKALPRTPRGKDESSTT
jgi:uncharacterized protein with von Willebrand factor type A (vWA) domain